MATLNLSYTAPINPPSATPVLTYPQIWAGLQRKIRFAQEFVPVIETCTVLEDKDGVVKRAVDFKKGQGPKDHAEETVRSYYPSWVDFEQEDGTHIRNIVSDGPSGELDNLNMTYTFEFRFPHLEPGSAELAEQEKKFKGMAKVAVQSTIDVIRQMVVDGKIKE